MSAGFLDRASEIFDRAAELAPGDRAAYLDAACAGDSALRREVEALLAAEDAAGAFLADVSFRPGAAAAVMVGAETVGSAIGPYTLVRELGDGGFGTVFLAEQSRPVRRKVALKIIKLGMDTRQVIGRFEAERQALALMDHPNIAKVFDAGATATGRPYFVMEFVDGEPVTRFCDREKLSLTDRLELFISVCLAVQHAHQKGIIHRDLKPGNVLVSRVGGQSVAKVIDFGIAKAISPSLKLAEVTLATQEGQFLGTPTYMSPEQALPAGQENVDTRSDVYSLGVMLYELLTGTTPFDPKSIRNATYADLQRLIGEVDPPRPSTRLSALRDTANDIALVRGAADPRQLRTTIRGELDWIVMKCLQKRRADRYDSASALVADIGRYLKNEPVEAGPPTRTYRLRKFLRRNRGAVVAAGLVLAVLVGGIVTTTLAAWRAVRAERQARAEQARAVEQQRLAEKRFNDVRKLAGSFIFEIDDAIQKDGPTKARERLVKTALEYLDALSKESSGAELLRELQESYHRVGMVQYFSSMPSIGDPQGAKASYRKSLELAERLVAMQPDSRDRLNTLAGCWYYLAEAQVECREDADALKSLDQAQAIYEKIRERYPEEWLAHRNVGLIVNRRGGWALDRGLIDEAVAWYEKSYRLREELLRRWPEEKMLQRDVRVTASSLSMALSNAGRPDEALVYLRRTLELLRGLVSRSPQDLALRREMYNVVHRLAEATRSARHVNESLALARELVDANRRRVSDDPADREAPLALSGALYTLGRGYLAAGPFDEALRAFEESRTLRAQGLKTNPNRTTERWVGDSMWRVTETLRRMGRYTEAEASAREAVAFNERRLAESPDVPTIGPLLVNCRAELALALAGQGRFDEALAALDEDAHAPARVASGSTQPATSPARLAVESERLIAETRGDVLRRAGRYDEAIAVLNRSITLSTPTADSAPTTWPAAEPGVALAARAHLARALVGAGRAAEALDELSRLLPAVERHRADESESVDPTEILLLARLAEYEANRALDHRAAADASARAARAVASTLLADPHHALAREVRDILPRASD